MASKLKRLVRCMLCDLRYNVQEHKTCPSCNTESTSRMASTAASKTERPGITRDRDHTSGSPPL